MGVRRDSEWKAMVKVMGVRRDGEWGVMVKVMVVARGVAVVGVRARRDGEGDGGERGSDGWVRATRYDEWGEMVKMMVVTRGVAVVG